MIYVREAPWSSGWSSSAIAQEVAVSREFEARRLENSLCQPSSKWVPFSN